MVLARYRPIITIGGSAFTSNHVHEGRFVVIHGAHDDF